MVPGLALMVEQWMGEKESGKDFIFLRSIASHDKGVEKGEKDA